MRFLFVMDPAETMLPDKDTSFAFMRGALARGHECWHCLTNEVGNGPEGLRVFARPIVVSDEAPHVQLGALRRLTTGDLNAVFIRKDPPFDDAYLHLTQRLDVVADHLLVVNHPRGLQAANEKLFALRFPEFTPATLVSANRDELFEFLTQLGGDGVLKPLDGAGGFGVVRLQSTDRNARALVDLLTLEGRRPALLQAFVPEVTAGDKRVLLLDGQILGAIRRVPRPDDIRANIHVGGSVEATELTPEEQERVDALAQALRREGLWFVGLDLIGGKLIEINVTSPTGLQQLSRHLGRPLERDVIAWAEGRITAKRTRPD
ncbi:MAG: glutathione synthase [Polyangiaceae bacterium]